MKQFYEQTCISSIHDICIAFILRGVDSLDCFNDNNKAKHFPMKK